MNHHNTLLPDILPMEQDIQPVTLNVAKISRLLAIVHRATAEPAMTPLLIALIMRCQDRKTRPEDALMSLLKEKHNEHKQ